MRIKAFQVKNNEKSSLIENTLNLSQRNDSCLIIFQKKNEFS